MIHKFVHSLSEKRNYRLFDEIFVTAAQKMNKMTTFERPGSNEMSLMTMKIPC